MPGNICPTFYFRLSQWDSLQMHHRHVQGIILLSCGAFGSSAEAQQGEGRREAEGRAWHRSITVRSQPRAGPGQRHEVISPDCARVEMPQVISLLGMGSRPGGIKPMICSVSVQTKAWGLQGAKCEPNTQSASVSLCLSWNNSES